MIFPYDDISGVGIKKYWSFSNLDWPFLLDFSHDNNTKLAQNRNAFEPTIDLLSQRLRIYTHLGLLSEQKIIISAYTN